MGSLRYIPTDLNCADDATTGLQAKVLGSEHRWFSRPEFMPLESSYSHCDELGILRDRGRLDRAELPYDAAHGSLHDLPKEDNLTQLFYARVNNRCQHAGVRNR